MRNVKHQKGIAVVEFALVLPILIMLLFGIIEFSLILYDKAVLTNASREGARYGIVSQSPRVTIDEITAKVNAYCQNHMVTFGAQTDPVVNVTPGSNFGDPLTVTVTYSYGFLLLPNFVTAVTGPVNLTATTVMRME